MNNQRGFAHLVLLLVLLLAIAGGVYALIHFKIISLPWLGNNQNNLTTKVELKTEYKNPFDKNTQYVNPFDEYKNPFVVAK